MKPDFETSASIDDVVSLDDSTSLENLSLSPTHYIEKAANVAVGLGSTYLPSSAQDKIAKGAFFSKSFLVTIFYLLNFGKEICKQCPDISSVVEF